MLQVELGQLCDRTEKALQKARLKNTIEELQEKLDTINEDG